jgi:signal transduction histidine kinase
VTRRLVLSYVVLAAFVLLLVELPLGLTYASRAEDRLLAAIERDARVLAGLVEERVEAGDRAAVTTITEQYVDRSGGRVVVTDAAGIALVDTSRPAEDGRDFSTRPEIATALGGAQATGIRRSDTLDEELAYVAVPISSAGAIAGVVRISFPTDELRAQIRSNWLRLALLSALVLAAAASVGWLIAAWAIGPVASLEAGASRLAAGDLAQRVEVGRGPPELRHLATTFNDMAAQLETLVGSQRAFVADASHQLRTPLTALRLRVEALEESGLGDPPDVAGARRDLAAIHAELERLGRLVEGLLSLARSESATAVGDVDLVRAAGDAVERWTPLAEEHGVRIGLRAPPTLTARVVTGGADHVLDNLLDNALGVAPPGSVVEVVLRRTEGAAELRVRDHGPGLPPDQRARATDRFWRAPDAPSGGTGLGLAIVAELVGRSGGSVELLEPAEGPGLEVVVRLVPPG